MSRRTFNMIMGAVSICIGGIIYIIFRPNAYISLWIGLGDIFKNEIITWIKPISFFLPDFLWAFSLCCFLNALFEKRDTYLCAIVTFLIGTAWEILQRLGILNGTGDFFDILMYLSALVLVTVINLKEKSK